MRGVRPLAGIAGAVVLTVAAARCGSPFGPEYEYEEDLYLDVDGAATVIINASVPALVALGGIALDSSPTASDRDAIRRAFEAAGCSVGRVSRPWRRRGRRYVGVRVSAPSVHALQSCAPLRWSAYSFETAEGAIHYRQVVGAAAGADPGAVSWDGTELVAFRLHLPGRITFHNVKRLDGSNGDIERGNILTWEQRLADRRMGTPVEIAVTMEAESILHRTLWLFGGSFLAAAALIATVVWWAKRRGRAG